ncbi:unnamed protein product [Coregonus sp. 'balchen']|nr:unnamed protein product [Coregonus sp. 'balchen']
MHPDGHSERKHRHNVQKPFIFCFRMSLILLLLLSVFVGNSMEQETITSLKPEVNALQETDITLSCNYKGNVYNLQWYRQYPGSRPECLLLILPTNKHVQNTSITTPRHTGRLNEEKTRVDLKISSVILEDSALYYCALQPTVTGNSNTLYKNLSRALGINRSNYEEEIISATTEETVVRAKPPYPHLTVKLNKEKTCVDLDISSAEVRDSALYYCALLVKEYADITPGFSLNHDKNAKRMDLEISSAELTDSALYYCALRPTVTGNPETLCKNL